MSLLIRDTPVLRAEDTREFLRQIKENETKSISQDELKRMKENYEKFKAIAKASGTEF